MELLEWQVVRCYVVVPTHVNNPINAEIPNHTNSSSCICPPFCSCFADLQDYFSTRTTLHPQQLLHTGSTVAIAIFIVEKKRGGE